MDGQMARWLTLVGQDKVPQVTPPPASFGTRLPT